MSGYFFLWMMFHTEEIPRLNTRRLSAEGNAKIKRLLSISKIKSIRNQSSQTLTQVHRVLQNRRGKADFNAFLAFYTIWQ